MDENADLAKQYQDILNQYSKELANETTEAVFSPLPETEAEVQNIPLTEIPPPVEMPSIDNLPLPPVTPDLPIDSEPIPPPPSVPSGNFFKILFFISLVIFLGVCGAIVLTVISTNQNATPKPTPTSTNPTPTKIATVCQLNDRTFPVGQSFWAADGCNTCTCQSDLTISCTQKVCEATPSVKLTPTSTASAKLTVAPKPTLVTSVTYAITNNQDQDLYLTFPKNTLVTKNTVKFNGSTYAIDTKTGPGLCPMGADNMSCTYTDQPDTKWQYYRVWTKDSKPFAINPQVFSVNDISTEGLIITKTAPTQYFTNAELSQWKGVLDNVIAK